MLIETPANIKRTTIVTTNATNVIPLSFLNILNSSFDKFFVYIFYKNIGNHLLKVNFANSIYDIP